MVGIKIIYVGKVFAFDDFNLSDEEPPMLPFLADVTAFIAPSLDAINVEIWSVRRESDGREFAAHLRHECRRNLETIMRSYYLNTHRAGLEGDVHDMEVGSG